MSARRSKQGWFGRVAPVCPHCGHEQEKPSAAAHAFAATPIQTRCVACDRKFVIVIEVEVRYSSLPRAIAG